jgi:hypothetical protein
VAGGVEAGVLSGVRREDDNVTSHPRDERELREGVDPYRDRCTCTEDESSDGSATYEDDPDCPIHGWGPFLDDRRPPGRISIPALREQASHPRSRDFNPWREILALVEAVEAAYSDPNHRTGCVVCGNLHGHADSCPGGRFDFGEDT